MGIKGFLQFIQNRCPNACQKVDLLDISRGSTGKKKSRGFKSAAACSGASLVIDAESCLDRLYGGYFPDWTCGGQWNNTVGFLTNLMQACVSSNLQLVVFFNGSLECQRISEWTELQIEARDKVTRIIKHVQMKGTPPPKIWWIPPTCLSVTLRMMLRQLAIPVCCSMDDHHQEVIAYCRENNFHGVVAEDPEYAVFDPPRLFSAHCLKLKFTGQLETIEYVMDEVAKCLDLHPNRFCVLAALLGNFILSEEDLYEFFCSCLNKNPKAKNVELPESEVIPAVVSFVRCLPDVEDLDDVGQRVFRLGCTLLQKERIAHFKHCVQYYMNGTKEGFLKYFPRPRVFMAPLPTVATRQPGAYPIRPEETRREEVAESTIEVEVVQPPSTTYESTSKETTAGYSGVTTTATTMVPPSIVIVKEESKKEKVHFAPKVQPIAGTSGEGAKPKLASDPHKLSSISSSSSSSDASSPQRLSPESTWSQFPAKSLSTVIKPTEKHVGEASTLPYHVPPEIMRIASERHQKGLMMPYVYQVLTQAEIKLPVHLEDERSSELPTGAELYAKLRQHVYGVLLAYPRPRKPKDKADPASDIIVKEWQLQKDSNKLICESVQARSLGWSTPTPPTIRQLWLGQKVEDKNRRLRAFLTCMGSDYTPLMLNTTYVPQRLLIMCAVLRYIMMHEKLVLRQYELDAFLAQSVSPMFLTPRHLTDIQLPSVDVRGIHVASLFMQGIEAAIFANDGCGAPIPWTMCCPWMFFDGRLFQLKLLKASTGASLHEICDGQVELVMRVERMRQAVVEGLKLEFAMPKSVFGSAFPSGLGPSSSLNVLPAGSSFAASSQPSMRGRGRGMLGRGRGLMGPSPMYPESHLGGELQVAGVVVGSWGGPPHRRGGRRGPSHVTSYRGARGRMPPMMPAYMVRPQFLRSSDSLNTYRQIALK
ncbi:constitutive coactivator of PPAR-gamma-like protein 1 homolog [Tubulanus polymorphus]|uniref:constitutive coactivator of PPAR-gamma-like protein 1 homolog n=1 Tax=Tubulanus polymorphus TaxID=672921 RepID=UPI003DA330DC